MKVDTLILTMRMQCPLIGLARDEDGSEMKLHRVSAHRIHALNAMYADCGEAVWVLERDRVVNDMPGTEIGWQWVDRDDLADDYRSFGLSVEICPVCESSR